MAEYIERDVLLESKYWDSLKDDFDRARAKCVVLAVPAADVVEVRHGRWVGLEYDGFADGYPVYDLWECSECGEEVSGEDVPDTHPYCHNCGARMDGE